MNPTTAVLLSWNFDPLVVVGLVLALVLYVRGSRRLAANGGFGRQVGGDRLTAAIAGWLTLVIALLSPIAVFSGYFLTAHMTQHLLVTQIAAPLLLLGRPVPTLVLGLPESIGRNIAPLLARDGPLFPIGSVLTSPFVSLGIFLLVFLGWHVPLLYDAAIGNPVLHDLEHFLFFWSAILFWWPAVDPISGRNQRRRFLSLISISIAFLAANALGIWFAFAGAVAYPSYQTGPLLFGVSPLDDQVAGGLVMWVGGSLLYGISAIAVLAAGLQAEERATRLREAREAALAG
ncbi:MAG: cytochrome c oxidase assembly protein [Dehalococcoidia bacterium]